jgi:hypothetical protein
MIIDQTRTFRSRLQMVHRHSQIKVPLQDFQLAALRRAEVTRLITHYRRRADKVCFVRFV